MDYIAKLLHGRCGSIFGKMIFFLLHATRLLARLSPKLQAMGIRVRHQWKFLSDLLDMLVAL
jgi:hypothetical protein